MSTKKEQRILLTGSTGYIGGRLAPRLLASGWKLRCLVRSAEKLKARSWAQHENVEIVEHDLSDSESLAECMKGCTQAFYLVHSMLVSGDQYQTVDTQLAHNFAEAAEMSGLSRIIYLGGLGETGNDLSQHLRSRRDVEWALAIGKCPVTVFRAAMIIGSGSASFEILRYLVERLPIMVTPRWVRTMCQPIGVGDVLRYLEDCLTAPATINRTIDIGGPDVLDYYDLMQMMAKALGLRRRVIVPLPVLTPRLSSLWIHLVTPVSPRIARPLAEGLKNSVVCRDRAAVELMPGDLDTIDTAIRRALDNDDTSNIETSFSDAGPIPGDPEWAGGKTMIDRRELIVNANSEYTFSAVSRIGGHHGYYGADWLWHLRAAMDLLVGGPGLRLGRRDPMNFAFGEAVDFWRVTKIDPGHMVRLRAEMKLPGEAVLEFEVIDKPDNPNCCTLVQTARFKPRGLPGLAYWYSVAPLHQVVFGRMIRGIKHAAEGKFVAFSADRPEGLRKPSKTQRFVA